MKRLLCTDLDGTLFPANGVGIDSTQAKVLFRELVQREDITLAYVTGRDRELIERAIHEHDLPLPDYAISDVGTAIYQISNSRWVLSEGWQREIGQDGHSWATGELDRLLSAFPELHLQESRKQGRYKLSFYISGEVNAERLLTEIEIRLKDNNIKANLISSVDPANGLGLLDVLPISANKLHAVRFLMEQLKLSPKQMVFAGDSGNDRDVLVSGLPAVLVANADSKMKEVAGSGGGNASLYVACGGFFRLDGKHTSGVLEGVAHFWPDIGEWLLKRSIGAHCV